MKIAYYVHGRGRGHSSRALSIIKKLSNNSGFRTHVFAGKDAFPVLKHLKSVRFINSIFPGSSFVDFLKRLFNDYSTLKKLKADCVISDGDAPSVIIGKALGVHVISIGHALIFPYCDHDIQLDNKLIKKENLKVRIATQLADYKFIVHFCQLKLKISNGLIVRPELNFEPKESTNKYLLSYFRDGNGFDLAKKMISKGWKIINFGSPIDLNGVNNKSPNTEEFRTAFNSASGIISSAGSNIIFECMALNKPLLAIFKQGDFEQNANCQYLEHLTMGVGLNINDIEEKKIEKFLLSIDSSVNTNRQLKELPILPDALLDYLTNSIKK